MLYGYLNIFVIDADNLDVDLRWYFSFFNNVQVVIQI
jgi:hypothetical protein